MNTALPVILSTSQHTDDDDADPSRFGDSSNGYSIAAIATSTTLAVVIVLTVIGNGLVVAAVWADRTLRQNAANFLVASLALADLMVAVSVMPLAAIYEVNTHWILGPAMCDLFVYMDVLCCTSSILHLVAISLDRYWAVKCVDYVRNRPVKKILVLVAVSWVVSAIIASPRIFGLKDDDDDDDTEENPLKGDNGLEDIFNMTLPLVFTSRDRVSSLRGDEYPTSIEYARFFIANITSLLLEPIQDQRTDTADQNRTRKVSVVHCVISQDLGYTIFSTVGAFYLPLTIMLIIYINIYRAARNRIRKKRFVPKENTTTADQLTYSKLNSESESKKSSSKGGQSGSSNTHGSVAETSEDDSSFMVEAQDVQIRKPDFVLSPTRADELLTVSANSSFVSLSPMIGLKDKESKTKLKFPSLRFRKIEKKVVLPLKQKTNQISTNSSKKPAGRCLKQRLPTDRKRLFKLSDDVRKNLQITGVEKLGAPDRCDFIQETYSCSSKSQPSCWSGVGSCGDGSVADEVYCNRFACKKVGYRRTDFGQTIPVIPNAPSSNGQTARKQLLKVSPPIISISHEQDSEIRSSLSRDNPDQATSSEPDAGDSCKSAKTSSAVAIANSDVDDCFFIDLFAESALLSFSEHGSPLEEAFKEKTFRLQISPHNIYFTSFIDDGCSSSFNVSPSSSAATATTTVTTKDATAATSTAAIFDAVTTTAATTTDVTKTTATTLAAPGAVLETGNVAAEDEKLYSSNKLKALNRYSSLRSCSSTDSGTCVRGYITTCPRQHKIERLSNKKHRVTFPSQSSPPTTSQPSTDTVTTKNKPNSLAVTSSWGRETLNLNVACRSADKKRHSVIAASKSMSALAGSMLDLNFLQVSDQQQRKSSFCTATAKRERSPAGNGRSLQPESKFNGQFFSQQQLMQQKQRSRSQLQLQIPPRLLFQAPQKPRKTPEERAREKREVRRERKAARTLGIITGSFVVCWLPFFTLALLRPFCPEACQAPRIIVSLAGWLGYLNSLLNPIIYTVFNPDFRLAFAKMLLGCCMDKRKIIGKVHKRRLPKFSVRKRPLVRHQ